MKLTTSHKVVIGVIAFCLTVAVTRRVQQEIDKETVQAAQKLLNTPATPQAHDTWSYMANLSHSMHDDMHALMCDSNTGRTIWAVQLVRVDESEKFPMEEWLALKKQQFSGSKSPALLQELSITHPPYMWGEFIPSSNEVKMYREDNAEGYFKIVKRLW